MFGESQAVQEGFRLMFSSASEFGGFPRYPVQYNTWRYGTEYDRVLLARNPVAAVRERKYTRPDHVLSLTAIRTRRIASHNANEEGKRGEGDGQGE